MATTFDLSSQDRATYRRSQLRLLIGDTTQDDGPRPGQTNFQDDELDALLSLEGDDLNRATARAYETLAGEWSRYAGTYSLGPESEASRQAEAFAARAATARELYGYALGEEGAVEEAAYIDWSAVYEGWTGGF